MQEKSPLISVKKFGGSSVGSLQRIEKVAQIIEKDYKKNKKIVVVLSAMSGKTNELVKMGLKAGSGIKGASYDMLLSSGEQISISLLALSLQKRKIPCEPLLAHQAGIKTDSFFSKARIKDIDAKKIKSLLKKNIVCVVAGFQGLTEENEITTLGRGGSDITAIALAKALKQKTCEIYTDVPKVFKADPRLVPNAKAIEKISYEGMMEMSSLGSKVLHCRSVELAYKNKIKIHVRSSFKPEKKGSFIVPKEEVMEKSVISAVCHQKDVVVLKLHPVKNFNEFTPLFKQIADHQISVDIITHNEKASSLAFSIDKADLKEVKKIFKEFKVFKKPDYLQKVAKVSIVGAGMISHPGVAWRFFNTFKKQKVKIYLLTTSEIKISAIISEKDLKKISLSLHKEFKL